jgi:hypothetical protein
MAAEVLSIASGPRASERTPAFCDGCRAGTRSYLGTSVLEHDEIITILEAFCTQHRENAACPADRY